MPFTSKKLNSSSHNPKKHHISLFRRISRYIPKNKKEYKQKKVPFLLFILVTVISSILIFKVIYTAYQYATNFELKDLLEIFSTELQTDESNRINILILGTGDENHEGHDLTDTIMIVSINKEAGSASMLSIPRDLWLDLPGYASSRINKVYYNLKDKYGSEQSLEILREGVENISNLEIPYYIKVDFKAFVNLIDTLGGIEVLVEKSIFDTAYPTENKEYETFSMEAGLQVMDGETALKYARSRHSTSDFDRALRQQQIIKAVKEKAMNTSYGSSPLLIKKLYEDFSENIETNLRITELISLAHVAQNIDQENLTSAVLKDIDIIDTGSFLYTPERELYGGAFVLIPIGESFESIQRFIKIVFDYPNFFKEEATLQILNGTRRYGLASRLGERLLPYGFNIQKYDNADRKNYEKTHYYIHNPSNTMATEAVIKIFFPTAVKLRGQPPEGIDTSFDITIVTGADMKEDGF